MPVAFALRPILSPVAFGRRRGLTILCAATLAGALLPGVQPSLAQTAVITPTVEARGEDQMTQLIATAHLKVPGATLYYETQGSGPLLLIIPGGPQDAGVFAHLGSLLAEHFTVVAYDPRGNSRSTFDGSVQALHLDQQGDDAAALIMALGDGPAFVFGTSGGAQIGLNLAARYPHLVQTLVAHEPPAVMLLDDPTEALAANREIIAIYHRDGVDAAMAAFFGMTGLEPGADDPAEPAFEMPPEAAEIFARVTGNFDYWLAHGMMPLSLYEPDIGALRTGATRVVIAIGEDSAGQPIYEMALAVAGRLGAPPVMFPGDHMGFEPHADAFAAALRWALIAP